MWNKRNYGQKTSFSSANFRSPNNPQRAQPLNVSNGYAPPVPMFGPRGATIPPKFIANRYGNKYQNNYNRMSNETSPFWCDTCDRGFRTDELLKHHVNEHQKCNIDGCEFVAHANIITKHIQMQHRSGLFQKISKLSNTEDISKWIAERKKKYPTKINIEKKQNSETEKQKRGEKLQVQKKRFDHQGSKNFFGSERNSQPQHKKITKNKRRKRTSFSKQNDIFNNSKAAEDDNQTFENLPQFRGLNEISKLDVELESTDTVTKTSNASEESDGDWEHSTTDTPTLCGALANLINCYGSSDEEVTEIKLKKVGRHTLNAKIKDDSAPEEVKIERDDPLPVPAEDDKQAEDHEPKTKIMRKTEHGKLTKPPIESKDTRRPQQALRRKLPSTLLSKLLHKEIIHERNVILQCVRHIKNKNYFQ